MDTQLATLSDLHADDPDLVAYLLGVFQNETPQTLQSIAEALEYMNRADLKTHAHALKGVCANMGFEYLHTLLETLEKSSESIAQAEGFTQLDAIQTEYERLLPLLVLFEK